MDVSTGKIVIAQKINMNSQKEKHKIVSDLLKKRRNELSEIKHRIGVCRGEDINAYCLVRYEVGNSKSYSVILCKAIMDRDKFDKEVESLSIAFNAKVIEEK